MRTQARLILVVLALSGCRTPAPSTPQPPVARKIPHVTKVHGETLVDDYYWLRRKGSGPVMGYLRAENAYTDWYMRPTVALQETLYREMVGRIQETDASVPYRFGEHLYYYRTEEGKQYEIYCRKHRSLDAPEEILLDLNELATGKPFIALGVYEVSDDGNLLAYSLDFTGFNEFTLYVKDLRTGKLLRDRIEKVDAAVWAADNQTIFYTAEDEAKRPYGLYRYRLGTGDRTLVFDEKDERFSIDVSRSRSNKFVFLTSASKTSSEVLFIPADRPQVHPTLIAPRAPDIEYYVDHGGDRFYIRTNDRGRNFRIVTAPVTQPGRESWKELVPARDDVMISGLLVFAGHFILLERANGLPQICVTDIATGASHELEFHEPAYFVSAGDNAEFDTETFRLVYESLVTPESTFDYNLRTRERTLLKREPVRGGYDSSRYATERVFAVAPDNTPIPISLVYRRDRKRPEGNPLLLDGYGSYGIPEDVWFSPSRLSLLDRGVVFAIAHVRGGGEFGKRWHDAGRMLAKRNTFTDFIACAEFLVANRYTSRGQLTITGGSAGGLLMGAALNLRPDLFHAALVEVPFVDVINTMLDDSLPLTTGEFEEWGNPQNYDEYRYMKSYSPYDNIAATNYPTMLVRSSLNDSLVMYWEPAKYVAKLRATKSDTNPLLLKVNLEPSGHHGKSGRYDALRDLAFDYAFILTQFGITQ